jgi:hypothetical protein
MKKKNTCTQLEIVSKITIYKSQKFHKNPRFGVLTVFFALLPSGLIANFSAKLGMLHV